MISHNVIYTLPTGLPHLHFGSAQPRMAVRPLPSGRRAVGPSQPAATPIVLLLDYVIL